MVVPASEESDIDAVSQQLSNSDGSSDALLKALGSGPAMERLVGRTLITNRQKSRQALDDLYTAAVERERLRYERAVGYLATLGSNANSSAF